jgi:hypothetical protein
MIEDASRPVFDAEEGGDHGANAPDGRSEHADDRCEDCANNGEYDHRVKIELRTNGFFGIIV